MVSHLAEEALWTLLKRVISLSLTSLIWNAQDGSLGALSWAQMLLTPHQGSDECPDNFKGFVLQGDGVPEPQD